MPPPPTRPPGRFRRADLLTSLLLVFPLLLVYQIGVLAVPEVYNGADMLTARALQLLHGRIGLYLLLNGALAAAFVITILVLRRRHTFSPRMFVPVLVESSLYAVSMGALIVFFMTQILHISPSLSIGCATAGGPDVGLIGKIILSFGAGVHEELVFRLILFSAIAALGGRLLGLRRGWALFWAYLASALLFSAAHHIIGGEPWRVGVFIYRVFCGLLFARLFHLRGFAVAVYTHALYDVFVLVLH